jgi:mannobiose 2-epimerase
MIEQDVSRLLHLKSEFSEELKSILEFWSTKCLDQTHGGFIGTMDHFAVVDQEASKGCILNARILWTFSAAYRTTGTDSYRLLADRAYDYLKNFFYDKENGGLFWELDYKGQVLNSKKQAYAQGFGVYAFSEYFRATGSDESLDFAKDLYFILEEKFWEPKFGGYIEALTANWQEMDDVRLSNKDLNTPKSMNTHLHILEPYTNLYRVWPEQQVKNAIDVLLQLFSEKIYNPKTSHLRMFFSLDWTSQFEEISFGHDIEGAWLINEAARVIQNGSIDDKVSVLTSSLLSATCNEGLDEDGSLFNEKHGNILDKDKHWWAQVEAMVGFMDAFELDQNTEHIKRIEDLWIFIQKHLKDTENGEWYWRVDANNVTVTTEEKAGFWKCPYHNGRALMELIERIDNLNKEA